MNLHDKIMNIGMVEPVMPEDSFGRLCYEVGHRDARHAAAEMANESDEIISELLEALELAHEHMKLHIYNYNEGWNVYEQVRGAIAKAKGLDNV